MSDASATDESERFPISRAEFLAVSGFVLCLAGGLTAHSLLRHTPLPPPKSLLTGNDLPPPLPELNTRLDDALQELKRFRRDSSPNDYSMADFIYLKLSPSGDLTKKPLHQEPAFRKVASLQKLIEAETVLGITERTFPEPQRSQLIAHIESTEKLMQTEKQNLRQTINSRADRHHFAKTLLDEVPNWGTTTSLPERNYFDLLDQLLVPFYANVAKAASIPPEASRSASEQAYVDGMKKQREEAQSALKEIAQEIEKTDPARERLRLLDQLDRSPGLGR